MAESKHTPGPWMRSETTLTNKIYTTDPTAKHQEEIARCYGDSSAEAEANAHLIAAAPELLKALKLAMNNLRTDLFPETRAIFKAAIAKAENRQ